MASPEGVQEGLSQWQTLSGAAAIFLTTAAGVLSRFVAKKAEVSDATKTEAAMLATSADSGPLQQIAVSTAAILTLLQKEALAAEKRRDDEEKDAIKDRLDKAEIDREHLMQMIERLQAGGAQHAPGRPIRDQGHR